jgi:hypothetical protein
VEPAFLPSSWARARSLSSLTSITGTREGKRALNLELSISLSYHCGQVSAERRCSVWGRSKKVCWEVKSLEPTFLPLFGRPDREWSGDSGDRTRDLSHPKRESYR